ncbi:MAG: thiol oxidoreductase [Kofleriaceae bacterium]|nr:thiol oxidoreductase [Kofleriaceae bacterium]MCB9572984.1 thiol oxidoreductase [Kofleriaceae bacterium]
MKRGAWLGAALIATISACADPLAAPPLAGGDATVFDRTTEAFSMPAPTLTDDELARHRAGDAGFEATFVPAPSTIHPGLGPTFNNAGCARCHLRDGRGMPVAGGGPLRSQLLVRVSLAAGTPAVPGGAVPVPGLGTQLQDQANYGVAAEATVAVTWDDVAGHYGDGAPYTLRRPRLAITLADGAALPADVQTSLRQPPPVFGLGLLEAVDGATLEALADPDDLDGDGVSGRVNHVWDAEAGAVAIGRFGHKANTPTLRQQAAAAYVNDMGVGSSLFPDDAGDAPVVEIDDDTLDATAFYTRTLAVPARVATDDPAVARGETLFRDAGCARCHVETLTTGAADVAALADQTIHPYTDLLVHDLGDDLADGRPDFEADGREWRTAPLWGLGLTHTVLPGSGFLHDGRARTLEEAILWHGGEAEAAREAFRRAPVADRDAVVAFLRSL